MIRRLIHCVGAAPEYAGTGRDGGMRLVGPNCLGVLNTARSHTHFLASPRMARVLSHSTFEPSELKRGRTSVYLVLPADRLDTYAAWMRLLIVCTLTGLARTRGAPASWASTPGPIRSPSTGASRTSPGTPACGPI